MRRLTTPPKPINAVPSSNIVDGSGTVCDGTATSLPATGTFWNLTKIALQISCSVKPVKAAPVTVNEALSPGNNPSFTEPPLKLPEGPVMNAKSRTTELNPAGTLPTSPSENVKFELKLGACIPVNPFNPEALALPIGGKSKPMPVIVDVDPGCVIAEVLVIVNVNVFVCALNSQTTVAVAALPLFTPEIVIVSACAVAETTAKMLTALNEIKNFRNRAISPPCTRTTNLK
jgi:hypothetical protein